MGNHQLKFKKYSRPAHCASASATIQQLCREMPDFGYSAQPVTS